MVIERYPVHHRSSGLAVRAEFPILKAGLFQTGPQAFRRRIIPAIAFSAHGGTYLPNTQRLLEFMTAILAASVAMEDQPCGRSPTQAIVPYIFAIVLSFSSVFSARRMVGFDKPVMRQRDS